MFSPGGKKVRRRTLVPDGVENGLRKTGIARAGSESDDGLANFFFEFAREFFQLFRQQKLLYSKFKLGWRLVRRTVSVSGGPRVVSAHATSATFVHPSLLVIRVE